MAKRFGKIFILEEDIGSDDTINMLSQLRFMPYRAEFLYHCKALELIGESAYFDEIDDKFSTPEYLVILDYDGLKVNRL